MTITPEEIIRMARDAGFHSAEFWPHEFQGLYGCASRFAELVAASEREACAIMCEVHAAAIINDGKQVASAIAHECAAAIRARGNA